MNQVIAENISPILLKRLIIFLGLFMMVMIIGHFIQPNVSASYPALNKADNGFELNKNDIVFASMIGQ